MVLHLWLLPAIAIFFIVLGVFYMAIKHTGGFGTRTDGRTVVDKPVHDESDTPSI